MDTVFIFSAVDFDQVQRHTEKYYLTKYSSQNFETHVISPSSRISGVINHHFRFDSILGILLLNFLLTPLWLKLFLTEDPDVVYCYPGVITPPLLARAVTDARVVFDIRADPFDQREEFAKKKNQTIPAVKRYLYSIERRLFPLVLNQSDLIVTLSDDLLEKLRQNYHVDTDSTHITPLGVDVNKFKPINVEHDDFLDFVYVGTINELRGLDTFFDALELLSPEAQSRLRVNLIGGGDDVYLSDLVTRVEESNLGITLEYHGFVDHDEVPNTAGQSDVAISPLPGLDSYNVSSPAKVYEYLALGLPIIATDIPAHHRILSDDQDSILVNPESAQEMADAVESLLNDPDRVKKMSERARETALKHSWESRFSELFEKIQGI